MHLKGRIMEKKNRKEEIQSRREFFKKAAKGILPVLGAVVLSSLPIVKTDAGWGSCKDCTGTCFGFCSIGCSSGCKDSCSSGCRGTCSQGCGSSAYGSPN